MNKKAMTAEHPVGPAFSIEEAQQADSMSITLQKLGNSSDRYEYCVIYKLHNSDGSVIKTKEIYE
jgi:hypothetical protein